MDLYNFFHHELASRFFNAYVEETASQFGYTVVSGQSWQWSIHYKHQSSWNKCIYRRSVSEYGVDDLQDNRLHVAALRLLLSTFRLQK
jgi:hypothetical protein